MHIPCRHWKESRVRPLSTRYLRPGIEKFEAKDETGLSHNGVVEHLPGGQSGRFCPPRRTGPFPLVRCRIWPWVGSLPFLPGSGVPIFVSFHCRIPVRSGARFASGRDVTAPQTGENSGVPWHLRKPISREAAGGDAPGSCVVRGLFSALPWRSDSPPACAWFGLWEGLVGRASWEVRGEGRKITRSASGGTLLPLWRKLVHAATENGYFPGRPGSGAGKSALRAGASEAESPALAANNQEVLPSDREARLGCLAGAAPPSATPGSGPPVSTFGEGREASGNSPRAREFSLFRRDT